MQLPQPPAAYDLRSYDGVQAVREWMSGVWAAVDAGAQIDEATAATAGRALDSLLGMASRKLDPAASGWGKRIAEVEALIALARPAPPAAAATEPTPDEHAETVRAAVLRAARSIAAVTDAGTDGALSVALDQIEATDRLPISEAVGRVIDAAAALPSTEHLRRRLLDLCGQAYDTLETVALSRLEVGDDGPEGDLVTAQGVEHRRRRAAVRVAELVSDAARVTA